MTLSIALQLLPAQETTKPQLGYYSLKTRGTVVLTLNFELVLLTVIVLKLLKDAGR